MIAIQHRDVVPTAFEQFDRGEQPDLAGPDHQNTLLAHANLLRAVCFGPGSQNTSFDSRRRALSVDDRFGGFRG